jgi:hypothetical protein
MSCSFTSFSEFQEPVVRHVHTKYSIMATILSYFFSFPFKLLLLEVAAPVVVALNLGLPDSLKLTLFILKRNTVLIPFHMLLGSECMSFLVVWRPYCRSTHGPHSFNKLINISTFTKSGQRAEK